MIVRRSESFDANLERQFRWLQKATVIGQPVHKFFMPGKFFILHSAFCIFIGTADVVAASPRWPG